MTETAKAPRPYALVRPCPHCPFRTDIDSYLRRERAREISMSIAQGGEFHCHETTVPDADDDSAMTTNAASKVCAGSVIVQEHMDAPNQMLRISEGLGFYDPSRMDMDAPVFRSFSEFIAAQEPDADEAEMETCGVVGPECEYPAGYMVGGTAVDGEPGVEAIEANECWDCGSYMCDSCKSDTDHKCVYCAEDGEDED